MKILGISGSLRAASWNTLLIETTFTLLPVDADRHRASLADLPLFSEDLEQDPPAAVLRLKTEVASADGLIVSSPEYNLGMPGVLKNAFDWLSRPPAEQLPKLRGKPVLLMGATPGSFGTMSAQNGCVQMFRALQMPVCPGLLAIPLVHESFRNGELCNDSLRTRLQTQVDRYLGMIADNGQ